MLFPLITSLVCILLLHSSHPLFVFLLLGVCGAQLGGGAAGGDLRCRGWQRRIQREGIKQGEKKTLHMHAIILTQSQEKGKCILVQNRPYT